MDTILPSPSKATVRSHRSTSGIRLKRRRRRGLLLDLPLAGRLTLGFLSAALIATLATAIIGIQRTQTLSSLSNFYQSLLQTTITLTTGEHFLEIINTESHLLLSDAAAPNPSKETLAIDQKALQNLCTQYNNLLEKYVSENLLILHPYQRTLLDEVDHSNPAAAESGLARSALHTWHIYRNTQRQILMDVAKGDLSESQFLERAQEEPTHADALSALRSLIQFDERLAISIGKATSVEQQQQLLITIIGAIFAFVAIALVGWFISSTLVLQMKRLRRVAQAAEKGEVGTRVAVVGHGEIADVAVSVNSMLDTIVANQQIAAAYEQQRQLNQLKDQFIVNVSHELRTPLTSVNGYIELLKDHHEELDTAVRAQFLEHAWDSCAELIHMVNTILDATQALQEVQPTRIEMVRLLDIVWEVIMHFDPRQLRLYEIHVAIPKQLVVWADPQFMRQILRNLISNVFKYAPEHTPITIQAIQDMAPGIIPKIRISVQDAGPGIPADELPLLFQKFVRLKRDLSGQVRGTGLGLYICKRLVEAMQGDIGVESSGIAGEGSCFYFTLPSAPSLENTHSTHSFYQESVTGR